MEIQNCFSNPFFDSIPFLGFLVGPKFGCEKIEIGKIGKKKKPFLNRISSDI